MEEEVEIVLNTWMLNAKKTYWPSLRRADAIKKALLQGMPANPSWRMYAIRTLGAFGEYSVWRYVSLHSCQTYGIIDCVKTGSSNGLLPDSIELSLEQVLTSNQQSGTKHKLVTKILATDFGNHLCMGYQN